MWGEDLELQTHNKSNSVGAAISDNVKRKGQVEKRAIAPRVQRIGPHR
jgi:hypothetical protein